MKLWQISSLGLTLAVAGVLTGCGNNASTTPTAENPSTEAAAPAADAAAPAASAAPAKPAAAKPAASATADSE